MAKLSLLLTYSDMFTLPKDLGGVAPGQMGRVCPERDVGQCQPVEESARDQRRQ